VTAPGIALVKALRIQAVETVHGVRELFATAPDDQVEVRAEEAPGDHFETKALCCLSKEEREGSAIDVVHEYADTARAAARDVIDPVREIASRSAGHVEPT
jgi:hypothetical protein